MEYLLNKISSFALSGNADVNTAFFYVISITSTDCNYQSNPYLQRGVTLKL